MEVMTLSPLHHIYLKNCGVSHNGVAKWVADFLNGNPLNVDALDILKDDTEIFKTEKCPFNGSSIPCIEITRELLVLWLVAKEKPLEKNAADLLRSKTLECIERLGCFKEHQLISAYRQLLAHFANTKIPASIPKQYKNGAAPIEVSGYWKWAELPHQSCHSELGVLWVMIAHLTQNNDLMTAASRIAHWQLNTLDDSFHPRIGIFNQENDAILSDVLTWNYLLYSLLGTYTAQPRLLYVAEKQLHHLEKLAAKEKITVLPMAPIIEKCLRSEVQAANIEMFELDRVVCDPDTSLVGLRKNGLSVLSTLQGGCTGLGSLLIDDLEIVTYGPQHLPHGDCSSFGILTPLKYSTNRSGEVIKSDENGFFLNGIVKIPGSVVSYSTPTSFRNCSQSELWADVTQEYANEILKISLLLIGYEAAEKLSFAFYVKADQCQVCKNKIIKPRSLDRYEGVVSTVELMGKNHPLKLLPQQNEGVMEIIPLAGGSSFWGADFLISFTLDKSTPNYAWKIM